MTYRVKQMANGLHRVIHASGVSAGDFPTSREAWRHVDKLNFEPVNRAQSVSDWCFKISGEPKGSLKRAKKAAKRLPNRLQDVAFTKAYPKKKKKKKDRWPKSKAGPVRHIDPSTVDVSAYLAGGKKPQ